MNVALLKKVRKQILAEPDSFGMNHYHEKTECGTTHCIGGWAEVLNGEEIVFERYGNRGYSSRNNRGTDLFLIPMEILRIKTEELANELFLQQNWDEPYLTKYNDATSNSERAKIAASYINYFIKKYS